MYNEPFFSCNLISLHLLPEQLVQSGVVSAVWCGLEQVKWQKEKEQFNFKWLAVFLFFFYSTAQSVA